MSSRQFILRLPSDHADRVREAIRSDALGERLQVEFLRDMRHARVKWDDETLSAWLADLPTVVECHKTLDGRTLYKTGDIAQVLMCSTEPINLPTQTVDQMSQSQRREHLKSLTINHGLTPPLKNVRKRRFRKTATKKFVDSPEVEKELERLLREDCSAIKVTYKIVTDEDRQCDDIQSIVSEAPSHTTSFQDEDSYSAQPTPSQQGDDKLELLRMLEEASCSSSESEEAESEEVLSLREAIQNLDIEIEAQQLKIQNTANASLRERFESFLGELQRQRQCKLDKMAELTQSNISF